jgi:hypothetical protein
MNTHDMKNIALAWLTSSPAMLQAIDSQTVISVMSSIVLPVLFFAIGKYVDARLQIYFQNRRNRKDAENDK